MIVAKQTQHRCVEVVNVDAILDSFEAKLIGGAVNKAFFYAGTRKPDGESMGMMVTSIFAFIARLKSWSATELGAEYDQGLF